MLSIVFSVLIAATCGLGAIAVIIFFGLKWGLGFRGLRVHEARSCMQLISSG